MKRAFAILIALVIIGALILPGYAAEAENTDETVYTEGVESGVVQDYSDVMAEIRDIDPDKYDAIEKYVASITGKLKESNIGFFERVANWGDSHQATIMIVLFGLYVLAAMIAEKIIKRGIGLKVQRAMTGAETANNNAVEQYERSKKELDEERAAFKAYMDDQKAQIREELRKATDATVEASREAVSVCRSCVEQVKETVNADDDRWKKNVAVGVAVTEVVADIAKELRIPDRRKDEISAEVERMRKAVNDGVVEQNTSEV